MAIVLMSFPIWSLDFLNLSRIQDVILLLKLLDVTVSSMLIVSSLTFLAHETIPDSCFPVNNGWQTKMPKAHIQRWYHDQIRWSAHRPGNSYCCSWYFCCYWNGDWSLFQFLLHSSPSCTCDRKVNIQDRNYYRSEPAVWIPCEFQVESGCGCKLVMMCLQIRHWSLLQMTFPWKVMNCICRMMLKSEEVWEAVVSHVGGYH